MNKEIIPGWLKQWFSPPVFPGDEEKTGQARLLFWVTSSLNIFILLSILVVLLVRLHPHILALSLLLILGNLGIQALFMSGRIRLASLLILVEGYAYITLTVFAAGSVHVAMTSAYILFVIVAGALFGRRAVVLATAAASLAVAGLMLLEARGLMPSPVDSLTVAQWLNYTVVLGLTGSVSWFATQVAREAVQRGRQEIEERQHAEQLYWQLFAEMEKRVAERTAELSEANLALEKASQLKNEFLASMSHELRTPLTGILGLSESMQLQTYGPLNERQVKSLRNIEASGRHLLELINDILDLSKIEAGELALQPEMCSVDEICQASLQLTRGMANKRKMVVGYANTLEKACLYADGRRLKQMLVNLLSNAIKFTPLGGQVGLEVGESASGQELQFTVWDQGIGIQPEDLPKLFKPFIQIDSSLSRQSSGSGLGLSLVSRLAEMHNGSIRVESTPGQGSRFTLSLPWIDAEGRPVSMPDRMPPPVSAAAPLAAPGPAIGEAKATILFADDNPILMETVSDFLTSQGYRVIYAASGLDLVEQARDDQVDLILTDIQMPGLDGLQAIRRIRAANLAHLKRVPIIAITALAMPGDRERFLEAGATHYLSKPLKLGELLQLVQSLEQDRGGEERHDVR
jgi:signal transduction histidine kinase/CheY-like chemotaxis protein